MAKPLIFAVVAPASGLLGMMGPSSWAAADMAVEDINAAGGVLGRPLRMRRVDSGQGVESVVRGIRGGPADDLPGAIVGTHPSHLRERLAGRLDGRIPYIYTPHYEGGECHSGVYAIGATPDTQIRPAIIRLTERLDIHRWYVIGHDYVWPHRATTEIVETIHDAGGSLAGSHFVPFRHSRFGDDVARIAASGAEGVITLLIGQGAVDFHRDFAAAGLSDSIVRFSPDVEENVLLAIGPGATANFFSCNGYFESLDIPENRAFLLRYRARFGRLAPLQNGYSQSLSKGLWFAKALFESDGARDVHHTPAAPRGRAACPGRTTYLAEAQDTQFRVIAAFPTA